LFIGWILISVILPDDIAARTHKDQPRFRKFRWSEADTGYHVTAVLQKGFLREIEESINAGIPTTFRFHLYLKRERWYWDNEIAAEVECHHTVTYDTLQKVYTIVKKKVGSSEVIFTGTTSDPVEMRNMMNGFEAEINFEKKHLKTGRRYYISLRATLRTGKLPPPWDVILFFLSHDFDTQTRREFLPRTSRK